MGLESNDVLDFMGEDPADTEGATERFLLVESSGNALRAVAETPLIILRGESTCKSDKPLAR